MRYKKNQLKRGEKKGENGQHTRETVYVHNLNTLFLYTTDIKII